ncbi:hypothetical protein AB0K27_25890 [Micromonospora echinospora]|uniref:Uncharacterized protein n=1 Tax=Micromonospora echinospora TaxID=1877 RepID=A0ABR6MBP7_MICEC|nr:hypothetical protein [Micromonospora echinospora]MBB5112802.1 hypothetical protein [Micromonospora echinospora]
MAIRPLWLCLFDAAADLLRLNPDPGPRPDELFHRFVAWTRHT